MEPIPPLDDSEVRALLGRMQLVEDGVDVEISTDEQHSNSLAKVRFPSGRILVIKRARYGALAERFDVSVTASRLLQEGTDLLAPRYLEVPDLGDAPPLLVYWWIPNPTLEEVWPELGPDERIRALVEFGRLLRRLHTVRLPGHGPLTVGEPSSLRLSVFLTEDLLDRLRPAVAGAWPSRLRSVDWLHEAFSEHLGTREEPEAVLVHNDLFAANILCSRTDTGFHCVGVLDFEDSIAGPVEADLAKTEVLHGPLFGRPLAGDWFTRVLEGYGGEFDVTLLALFRVYHLLNMGFHAAAIGLEAHATEVGRAIERELDQWPAGRRHHEVLV